MAKFWPTARVLVVDTEPGLENFYGFKGTIIEIEGGDSAIVRFDGGSTKLVPLALLRNVTKRKRSSREDTRTIGEQIADRQRRRRR